MYNSALPFQQMIYHNMISNMNMNRVYYRDEELKVSDFKYATSPRWTEFEHWMENSSANAKNTSLFKLGIPGTHDSRTYQLFTDEIYDVMTLQE